MRYCYHRLGGLFHVDRASSPPPQPSLAHLVILIAIALISGFKNLIRVLFFLCVGADVISGVCFSLLLFSPLLFSFLLFSSLFFSLFYSSFLSFLFFSFGVLGLISFCLCLFRVWSPPFPSFFPMFLPGYPCSHSGYRKEGVWDLARMGGFLHSRKGGCVFVLFSWKGYFPVFMLKIEVLD